MRKVSNKPSVIVAKDIEDFKKKFPNQESWDEFSDNLADMLTNYQKQTLDDNKESFQKILDDLMKENAEAIKSGDPAKRKAIVDKIKDIYVNNSNLWSNLDNLQIDDALKKEIQDVQKNILKKQGLLTYGEQQVPGPFRKKPDVDVEFSPKPDVPKITGPTPDVPKINAPDLPNKTGKFKPSLGGLITAGAAAALSAYAPKSKAATVMEKISEADPLSFLFPSGLNEGEDAELEKMKKDEYYKNLMKNMPENELVRSEEEFPAAKLLRGELIDNPESQLGEQESPDLEEMDKVLNYKDYLNKRKKSFGYE